MAYTYGSNTYCTINGSSAKAYQMRVGYELVSQSVANNTSTLNVIVQVRVINDAYETYGFKQTTIINGQTLTAQTFSVRTVNTWVTFGTKQITVSHQDNGDYSGSISASFTTTASDTYALKSGSASVSPTLASIPRATTPTVSKTNISFNDSITISTPRASTSFTHELYFKIGTSAKTMIANGSTQANAVTTSFTWSDIKYLMNWVPDSTSGTIIIYCQTYNGDTYIGEKSISLTASVPSDILPSVSLSVSEYVSEVANKIGKYVASKSRLKISATGSGNYASTVKSYKITIGNNETYNTNSVTTNVLTTPGDITITATVTDSRGRQKSASKTITVYDYSAPYIEAFNVVRCSNTSGSESSSGVYAKLILKAGVVNLSNNTASYKVGYKLKSAGTFTYKTLNLTALSVDTSVVLTDTTFSTDNTYDFTLIVTDVFGATSQKAVVLDSDFVLMDNYKDGTGVAFGKVADTSNLFDVNLESRFLKGINALEIPANTNLNNCIIPGPYRCRANATVATLSNAPTTNAFHMYVGQHTANGVVQIIVEYVVSNFSMYVRNMYNGSWGGWCKLSMDGHTHSYLPLSGGTINGDLALQTLTASAQVNANKLAVTNTGTFGGNVTMSKDLTVNGLINGMEFDDTGWVECTYASGFTTYSGYSALQVRRIGKVVYLRGYVTNTSAVTAATSAVTIATIPEGYRPSSAISQSCQGSGYNSFQCQALSSGELLIGRYGANGSVGANAWLCVSGMSWTID